MRCWYGNTFQSNHPSQFDHELFGSQLDTYPVWNEWNLSVLVGTCVWWDNNERVWGGGCSLLKCSASCVIIRQTTSLMKIAKISFPRFWLANFQFGVRKMFKILPTHTCLYVIIHKSWLECQGCKVVCPLSLLVQNVQFGPACMKNWWSSMRARTSPPNNHNQFLV